MKKISVLFVMLVVASTVALAENNELKGKIQSEVQKAANQYMSKAESEFQLPESLKSAHDALLKALNATFESVDPKTGKSYFTNEERKYFYHQNLIGPAEELEKAYVQLKTESPELAKLVLEYLKKQSYLFGWDKADRQEVKLETILCRLQIFPWNEWIIVEIHVNVLRFDLNNR